MNPMLKDPAAGIPAQLLPHLHLVSKYRYPITSNPSFETIVGYLLEAPKIVRDLQPVQWQLIETPADGTLMLTWQPLEYLGTSFASDGYVWADAEHVFKSEVRGYTLEMFLQRSGYRASGETMACHSRRRYRLLPGNANLGLPHPDPALFLTHYSKATARDHIPASSIPVMPPIHAQLQSRRLIQGQGQLPRKEFMLHDRSNWPMIQPQATARAATSGPLPPAPGHRRGPSIVPDTTLEDEEDVSRGDLLDFMSPRDISRVRYEQHHEWMEEILESPYPTLSIVPTDLGLGRKGALEELTKDFFSAPVSVGRDPSDGPPPRVGKLAEGKADEFAKRASAKLADMQVELEKMRKRHARRLDKLTRSTALKVAEKKLRMASAVPEKRRLSDEASETGDVTPRDALEEIMYEVELQTGRKLYETTGVRLVSNGGLEDQTKSTAVPDAPAAETTASAPPAVDHPVDGVQPSTQQQAAAPAGAQGTEQKETSVLPSEQHANSTTGAQPTPSVPQPDVPNDSGQQPRTDSGQGATDLPPVDDLGVDAHMDGLDDNSNQEGNEWVMIDEEGGQDAGAANSVDLHNADEPPRNGATLEEGTTQAPPGEATSDQAQTSQTQPSQDGALDTPNFDIGGDFDNVEVDTAGDALASYGQDEDLNLDGMEDSAFGDAFHPEEDDEMS